MLAFLLLCVVAWTCYAIREWSKDGPSAPSARPSPRGQLDLVQLPALPDDPSDEDPYYGTPDDDDSADDEDTDPDRSESSATWYDSRSCWGCAKRCKASKFRPYGCNIGAEVRAGYAARARAQSDLPYHSGFAPSDRRAQVDGERATSVSAMWSDLCQRCGEWVRSGGSVVKASTVAVDAVCPF